MLPPGDIRIVLTACCGALELELELLLLELELDELAACGGGHGGTAMVCARVPLGTMIVVEPAGGLALLVTVPTPCDGWPPVDAFSVPGVGHGGMLISMSLRCFARMTVRTPGVWSADATGSVEDELLLELELPPHAPSATASAETAASPSPVRATALLLPAIRSPSARLRSSPGAYPGALGSETYSDAGAVAVAPPGEHNRNGRVPATRRR